MIEDLMFIIADQLPATAFLIILSLYNHKLLNMIQKTDQKEAEYIKEIKQDLEDLKKKIGVE
jgi:hypothetical protein